MSHKCLKSCLLIAAFITGIAFLSGCAPPNWVHAPAAPDYYPTEPIPIVVGITIDEPPFSAQWWGPSKTRQDYGPEIVDYFRRMRIFKNVVYPSGPGGTVDADMYLSIRGKWAYDNKGRAVGAFLFGTPDYNDFTGTHNIKVTLKARDKEIDSFAVSVDTKGQYSAGDANLMAKELNDLQIKKIAVELANRFNADRAIIIDRISQSKGESVKQDTEPQTKDEASKDSIEKLDKLRKDGVISEDEYKRAKGMITPAQTDNSEINNKLQELSELHKNGVLSAEDYNKAKKRLIELQKLNELRQSGILTEDEYNKAKSRLMDK